MPKIKEKPTLVEVESAIPLTPQQLETLQDRLKTLLKINQLQFDLKVKPKLISGISVKVGSVVIDASLKGMLAQFESELKQTAVQSMDAKKIADQFQKKIGRLSAAPRVVEIGEVLSVSDGVARVNGLKNIAMGERVQFASHQEGIALNLNQDSVDILIFNDDDTIKEGERVYRTSQTNTVPVGMSLLGRVVNALGQPIDGKEELTPDAFLPMTRPAPGIIDRDKVNRPRSNGD